MQPTVLDREVYTEAGAASLLGVAQPTLHYWLEGGERRGKMYRPIIRLNPTGRKAVTWAEFIEASLLKQYRRAHKIPMVQLRAFIDHLRDTMEVPYPLAHVRPFVSGRTLLVEAQGAAHLDAEFALIATVDDQLVLTPTSEAFYTRVTWEDGVATQWRPSPDSRSKVIVDPEIRGGRPSVAGISTRAIWEQSEGDATRIELAEMFDLSTAEVSWALQYEMAINAA